MASGLILDGLDARNAILRGVTLMTSLLRATIGPVSASVAMSGAGPDNLPEVLSDAATIARRTIQIDDPFEDMGAMIVRQMACSVHDTAGDGAATAAVLCNEMVRFGHKYIAAGGNAMAMCHGLEQALEVATAELRMQMRPIELPAELARIVSGTVRQPEFADMIGEIVEALGPDGAIFLEDSRKQETAYDYVQGCRWETGSLSYLFLEQGAQELLVASPRILLTDMQVQTADLLPILESCIADDQRNLLIVTPAISDSAIALLTRNRDRGVLTSAVAVKAPGLGSEQADILTDLAAITGARPLMTDRSDRIAMATVRDLGSARQAWVTSRTFGILGGQGEITLVRDRIASVKAQLKDVGHDVASQRRIQRRIGNLTGSSAIIRVGAPTSSEQQELRARIDSGIRMARLAFSGGGVAGGGAAYIGCLQSLGRLQACLAPDEAFGVSIVMEALAAPIGEIARNAGFDMARIRHDARSLCPEQTFDVLNNVWVDAWQAGIVDPLSMVLTALEKSISAARMLLTTDVLIHRRSPEYALTP